VLKTKNISFDFSKTSFNAGLVIKELISRGVKVKYIKDTQIILAKYQNHQELFYDIHTNLIEYPFAWIINDKYYTKKWLEKNNIPFIPGLYFDFFNINKALDYAQKISYPVVIKPTVGSHGDNVYTHIENPSELKLKIQVLIDKKVGNGYYLVEKHIEGNEYRLFISSRGFFAAVARTPANVVGDGCSNLLLLIQKENFRRMNPRKNCLCEIRLDDITFDFMEKNNLNLDYVPKKGKKIFLRGNSNVSTGGNCHDVTDIVHPTVIKIAQKILASFPKLPFVGIDIICQNISQDIINTGYYVCELNSAPGLSLHTLPETGKPRNVVKELVDLLFPET
jgi:cyanophycin synthetase